MIRSWIDDMVELVSDYNTVKALVASPGEERAVMQLARTLAQGGWTTDEVEKALFAYGRSGYTLTNPDTP